MRTLDTVLWRGLLIVGVVVLVAAIVAYVGVLLLATG
jgi:hypothetical protein